RPPRLRGAAQGARRRGREEEGGRGRRASPGARSAPRRGGRTTMNIDDLANLPPPTPPPIGDALEKELAALAPVKTRRPLRQLGILAGISVIYGAALVAALTTRKDMAELPMHWLLAAGIAWLAGFLFPAYLALVPRPGSM